MRNRKAQWIGVGIALLLLAVPSESRAEETESGAAALAGAKERVGAALARWGREAEDAAAEELRAAFLALAGVPRAGAVEHLGRFLHDKRPDVARLAARCLGETPPECRLLAGRTLAACVDAKRARRDPKLVVEVIRSLGKTGYLGGHANLARTLRCSEDFAVVLAIGAAYEEAEDPRGVAVLLEWIQSGKSANLRQGQTNRKGSDPNGPRRHRARKRSTSNGVGAALIHDLGTDDKRRGAEEVESRLYHHVYKLLGREFSSWGQLQRYLSAERKALKKRCAGADQATRDQDREIRVLRRK